MSTKYERLIINPILKVIEKNQDYLCKPENLPQLAKLGYMFNTLWYSGRLSYGYNGKVKKGSSCENNPKYEIGDNIEYNSEENENLIYDAWGMHVSNDDMSASYNNFKKIVLEGKELMEFEKKSRKPNKTFDEWVEIMTDDRYPYKSLFPDRRSVANYLLCTIGTGYGYNSETGMIIEEASGADQDIDLYGEWENAVFEPSILEIVKKILDVPECKIALDTYFNYVKEIIEKRKEKELKEKGKIYDLLVPSINKKRAENGLDPISVDDDNFYKIVDEYLDKSLNKKLEKPIQKYEYYPISNYSIITKLNENSHPSYIKAALEICEDIVANPPEIKKNFNQFQIDQRNEVLNFCENFIKKFKKI